MQVTLPQDLKMEVFCLGAILNSVNAATEAFCTLEESDFFDTAHKKLFSLMKETFCEDVGCTMETMFAKMGKAESNFSRDYLLYLDQNGWIGMPYNEYFATLRNISGLRRSCFAAQELLVKASSPNAVNDDVLAEHQKNILKSMGINNLTLSNSELFGNYKNNLSFLDYALWKREKFLKGESTYEGVKSSYPILDQTLGSFQDGRLYYIGARTSMGKTTFILNLIANMMKDYRVGMFSLEMDAQAIFEKIICIHCGIKYSDFSIGKFSNEQFQTAKSLEKFLSKDRFFVEDEESLPISKLIARAKRMKKSHNIDILFIDYLTLVRSDTKYATKHLQVDEVSKGLQSLAKALKIPVVCLAQLNRASIGKEDDRPSLAHFRESGSIEEDADACILLHRPDYYNPHSKSGHIEVIVAKNRMMGTLRKIDFSCSFKDSDRYTECPFIEEQVKAIQENEFDEKPQKYFGD